MSEWKVFADSIEIFPHPNADKMELGRVGSFQVVVGKGLYKTGDRVVFAPKRSILPPDLRPYFINEETGHSYLRGPNEDRVGSIRLRGEESEGVILPKEWWEPKIGKFFQQSHLPQGGLATEVDVSSVLGITEYTPGEPGVPKDKKSYFADGSIIIPIKDVVEIDRFVRHDVESFRIFENEFVPGEPVVVTEKIHGSQISVIKDRYGKIAVTSKGRALKNFALRKYPVAIPFTGRGIFNKLKSFAKWAVGWKGKINEYWKVAEDSGIINFVNGEEFVGKEVQVIGEVVPFQSGFSYGKDIRTVLVFRVILNTVDQPYGGWSSCLNWVPLLYKGPYELDKILPLANGKENVSGWRLHIREGIVLTPEKFRRTARGVQLLVKILNEKYKSNDEDPV